MNKPTLPQPLKPGAKFERFLQIENRDAIDQDARTVTLAFASEAPVERYWGVEILDVASGSMDMSRMKSGAPLLVNHDPNDQVGVIQSVQIGADRVARAVVRFGKSARASEIFQDVVDGIRPGVSVAYQIKSAILESEEDGVGTYRITQWQPYEITLASIPADINVGVGRSAQPNQSQEDRTMPPENNAAAAAAATPAVDEAKIRAEANATGVKGERARVADINANVAALANFDGMRSLGDKAITEGWTADQFRTEALKLMATKQGKKELADIGMSDRDLKQYSFVRALNALANPSDMNARKAAAFEFEASDAAAVKQRREVKGLLVPVDVLKRSIAEAMGVQQRASNLLVGTASAGGNLVATDLLTANFIDLLRNAMVINRMGAQYLTGLVGNIAIPKQTGGGTFYWVAEDGTATGAGQTFGQVPMSPHTGAAKTQISRKLLLQSAMDVEAFVRGDIAKIVGLGIQAAAINGGGTNEPSGILATSGIGNGDLGTDGANPSWLNIVNLETLVAVANADVGTLGYLTNAKVRGYLKGVQKFTTNPGGDAIWTGGNTPLNGYQAGVTNAVPANLTKGTSSGDCSALIFGNFADLIIGMWGGLELQVDPFSAGDAGAVIVRAFQDVDVAVRHAESFAAAKDVLTA